MSYNISRSLKVRSACVWLGGKGKRLWSFVRSNAIVLVPLFFVITGDYGYALIAFLLGVAFEIYTLFKYHHLWLRPAVDKVHTLIYGKPLYKHLWAPGEWDAMKKRKWKIKWGW